jgi:ABC-type polysaccharide/polyol phosphate transport system ATPase subunit
MLSSLQAPARAPLPAAAEAAVVVQHVTKRYRRYEQRSLTLKGQLVNWLRQRSDQFVEFEALRDVSLSVRRGEAVAVIGRNGAGKSTLLKVISGIVEPDAGKVRVTGRLSPLLQLGTGFAGDLTGRRNIYMYGALLGLTRKQVEERLSSIIEFSGIEQFIDTPLKHYSTGMAARLGFAVVAHMDPDILLLDEVLSVGDEEFSARCRERMNRFREEGRTIIMVTHNLQSVMRLCDRALLLDHGAALAEGAPERVLAAYRRLTLSGAGGDIQPDYEAPVVLPLPAAAEPERDAAPADIRPDQSGRGAVVARCLGAALPLFVLAVFAAALGTPFVQSDFAYLAEAKQAAAGQLLAAFEQLGSGFYHPFAGLWFAVLAAAGQANPLAFHLAALALLAVNGWLVMAVAGEYGLGRRGRLAAGVFYACHTAFLWWAGWAFTAGSELAIAFCLLALWLFGRPVSWRAALGTAAFAAALGCGERAALLPVVIALGFRLYKGKPRDVLSTLGLWAVGLTYAVLHAHAMAALVGTKDYALAVNVNMLENAAAVAVYASGLTGAAAQWLDWLISGLYVLGFWAAVLGGALWLWVRQRRAALFGVLWFVVGSLWLLPMSGRAVDPYYLDFALLGLAIAVGALLDAWLPRVRLRWAGAALLAAYVGLGAVSVRVEMGRAAFAVGVGGAAAPSVVPSSAIPTSGAAHQ